MQARILTLAAVFLCCAGLLELRATASTLPERESLAGLPLSLGDWHGHAGSPLDKKVLDILGADDYTTRIYADGLGHQLGLYIGYHATQRQGDSIHSPMNCLPGAGWQPMRTERLSLDGSPSASAGSAPAAAVTVNKVVIQKGEDRQLVLYWYQSHGRIVASEYAAKAWLFVDAMRSGRTDAALVRIVARIDPRSSHGELDAQDSAISFAQALLPLLPRYLPR
jgi:EpsI family protein